jgi:pyroglutamyl-peptidase
MIKILVTGFSAFPGMPANPSAALLLALNKKSRSRLQRLGIAVELRELPVAYDGLGLRLAALAQDNAPDAILQFGVAGRRKAISIEMLARNRANILHPDAFGAPAPAGILTARGPHALMMRVPAIEIAAALRRHGIPCALSRNAGDYICNASFYHSLALANVACVGFIHIPSPRRRRPLRHGCRHPLNVDKNPRFDELVRAAEIALIVVGRAVRRARLESAKPLRHEC